MSNGARGTGARLRVAIQGEPGSFSHEALCWIEERYLRVPVDVVPCRTARDADAALSTRSVDAALLPVENSLVGGVPGTLRILVSSPVVVVGEWVRPIRHCLLAVRGSALESVLEVRSHPVALGQCSGFFESRPHLRPVAVHDTAGAARMVAARGDGTVAAIAPCMAAERYGLDVLASDLQDRPDNQTRFLLLRPSPADGGGWGPSTAGLLDDIPAAPSGSMCWKVSMRVEPPHRPGALAELFGFWAERGLDVSFVQALPSMVDPWHYRFYVECTGTREALDVLGRSPVRPKEVGRFELLGTYPRRDTPSPHTSVDTIATRV